MTAEDKLQEVYAASKAYKEAAEKEIKGLKALVARYARENEALKAYSCHNLKCKERTTVKVCPNCGQIMD